MAIGERVAVYSGMIGSLIAQDHEIGLTFCNKVSVVLSVHFGRHCRYIATLLHAPGTQVNGYPSG